MLAAREAGLETAEATLNNWTPVEDGRTVRLSERAVRFGRAGMRLTKPGNRVRFDSYENIEEARTGQVNWLRKYGTMTETGEYEYVFRLKTP